MPYLIAVVLSVALFGGFLALLAWEQKRGMRLVAIRRAAFDTRVEQVTLVLTHSDLVPSLETEVRAFGQWFIHEVAHFSLMVVREVERVLTRLVKYLRTRQSAAPVAPLGEPTRAFVKTLRGFKAELRASTASIPTSQTIG